MPPHTCHHNAGSHLVVLNPNYGVGTTYTTLLYLSNTLVSQASSLSPFYQEEAEELTAQGHTGRMAPRSLVQSLSIPLPLTMKHGNTDKHSVSESIF